MRHRVVILVGLLTAFVLAGVARQSGSEPTTVVKVDGSSTVFPITEAVAEEFQKETRGVVRVTVGISGTGGGFKKFCRGETDVQDASRPISQSEMDACRATGIQYYELPIAFDALTIAVSPQATWVDAITIAELRTDLGPCRARPRDNVESSEEFMAGDPAETLRRRLRFRHVRLFH